MSVNYAAGLSAYENKGKCGLPEIMDPEDVVMAKVAALAEIIQNSRHLVVHTGAGISTGAGIPDFRGPKGVWTLEKQGIEPKIDVTFDDAQPTFTHMALKALEQAGLVKYLITQNVDGLHLRSGFPRDRMSELHGNMFLEECTSCGQQQVRSTVVSTIGQRLTGAICDQKKRSGRFCRGKLKDVVLDWEDNLPEFDLRMAEHHSKLADVSLCLGSTLQIVPAGNLPLFCKKKNGKLVIVNLQKTKHHNKADIVIHAKVDDVFRKLLHILNIPSQSFVEPQVIFDSINGPAEISPQLLPENGSNRKRSATNSDQSEVKRKFEPVKYEESDLPVDNDSQSTTKPELLLQTIHEHETARNTDNAIDDKLHLKPEGDFAANLAITNAQIILG